ncbi:uncharacterized protein LOC133192582 [Saccostrea echinata]|uniref:uncharacterized protein LOC133192582 n=1 Tax=Saccostrea echinata TaxID=191078 RepID=UPI002A82B38B|nr:uncharacterized protein LOC133192582 [Saccostrea echinata]XP_061184557.1 uncharacterized protein LOC133192582 [Saccostrea echinata]XP_061184558.1 uncharacterized protein LOC133192582 [Saccostrea echinata]
MLFVILLLISTLTSVRATYAEDFHWAKAVRENEGADLECYEPNLNLNVMNNTGSVEWKKPNGVIIRANDNDFLLEDKGGYKHMRLTIHKVNSTNNGIYKCVLTGTGTKLIRGINVRGPVYTKFLDQYEYNIIVAVVATVVFLVPLLGSCGVYKFRYIEDKEEKQDMFHMRHGESDNGQAMVEKKTIAAKVEANEGGGAYENVNGYDTADDIDTKL